jgi:hypothetical protein
MVEDLLKYAIYAIGRPKSVKTGMVSLATSTAWPTRALCGNRTRREQKRSQEQELELVCPEVLKCGGYRLVLSLPWSVKFEPSLSC